MVYQIFNINDYKILAPLKCGSRYLEKYLGTPQSIDSSFLKSKLIIEGVKLIIIRSPLEHIISALHTEILGEIEENTLKGEDVPHEKVFLKHIRQFKQLNNGESTMAHWSPNMYKEIYFYWRRNREYVKLMHLSQLTSFLRGERIQAINHDPNHYNFHQYKYWCSKEDLMFFIMENYKSQWEDLKLQIEESEIWYNHLMNKEIIEINTKIL